MTSLARCARETEQPARPGGPNKKLQKRPPLLPQSRLRSASEKKRRQRMVCEVAGQVRHNDKYTNVYVRNLDTGSSHKRVRLSLDSPRHTCRLEGSSRTPVASLTRLNPSV